MDSCDVVIIGGGPAGSSCAWKLRNSGLDIMILDRQKFPRDKMCGGWILPEVSDALAFDPEDYSKGRILQPISGIRVSMMGGSGTTVFYEDRAGFGVRRSEFDQYLIERSGVWLLDGEPLASIERNGKGWVINKGLKADLIVGAGGHSCPVAQFLGADTKRESVAVAQEVEFHLNEEQMETCSLDPGIPEIYFCPDLEGFGWCFRKKEYLSLGLGRSGYYQISAHAKAFLEFLVKTRKIGVDIPEEMASNPYLLYGSSQRRLVAAGAILIGDAAGLANPRTGEGILRAVQSGLMAGQTILEAERDYSKAKLEKYPALLKACYAGKSNGWMSDILDLAPCWLKRRLAGKLLTSDRFARALLDRLFLNSREPKLARDSAVLDFKLS